MIESVLTLPVLATVAITAERFVTPGGAVPDAGANCLGVALHAALAGEYFAADVLAVSYVTAGAAIANGAAVQTDSSGRAITRTSGAVLARALSSAASAGDRVKVLLIPTGDMSEAAGPSERVSNGTFVAVSGAAAPWVVTNGAWAFIRARAESTIPNSALGSTAFKLYQAFASTIPSGTSVTVALNVAANPGPASLDVQLRMNGVLVDTVSTTYAFVGAIAETVTTSGPVNEIWFACSEEIDLAIDNVSVIA